MTSKMQLFAFVTILILYASKNTQNVKGQFLNINSGNMLTEFIQIQSDDEVLAFDEDSLHCMKDLDYFMQQLNESRKWAMEMFDAWAKGPPSGVFYGNTINYGNFDQCLSVNHLIEDETLQQHIKGKHCTITIQMDDPQRKDTLVLPERLKYEDLRFLPQPTMNK